MSESKNPIEASDDLAIILAERQRVVAEDSFFLTCFALVIAISVFFIEVAPLIDYRSDKFSRSFFIAWILLTLLIVFLISAFWNRSIEKSLLIVNNRLPDKSDLRISPLKWFLPFVIALFCIGIFGLFVNRGIHSLFANDWISLGITYLLLIALAIVAGWVYIIVLSKVK